MRLAPGTRVRVLRDSDFGPGPWPDEPAGRIGAFGRGNVFEIVQTTAGPTRTYWVTFDEPQHDVDGNGPYTRAQVLERYLVILPDS